MGLKASPIMRVREIVMFSAGSFTPAADGSQWDVSTAHAWGLEERAARGFHPRSARDRPVRKKQSLERQGEVLLLRG
jgi:hypothetical protein